MRRKLLLGAVLVAGTVGGCRHKCCSQASTTTPRPYLPLPPSAGNIPPPGVPITPAPIGGQLPPADLNAFPGGSVAPAPSPAPATKGPAPEILLPDPVPGGKSSLSSPGGLGPPQVSVEPPVASGGLSGFVRVNAAAASGRKPALDGFDTLKRQGFKSVVYLHGVGADVAAVRDVAERKGLTFTAVETTPEKLADAAAALDRVLADRSAQPVYVFDDDGVRAGALWYVHFRTADQLSPEVARIRAGGLGLRDDGDEARAFWVAIQQHFGR